ncbi:39S ribosomal protein L34, mitochondrial [Belonocnema kinseyi]|uniref:39S ribosomal protein L34, mitochondrial n=1 Tax=Belonocnema kinseyi TaxID=2817044 RepID=UPI00143CEC12|nr:39S ribosomal protein L34, mitochondrial [Belonocnema kinseyi]
MIGRLASTLFNAIPSFVGKQMCPTLNAAPSLSNQLINGGCNLITIRTNIRYFFPRPNEVRRIRRHGWHARMATLGGRKVIMRRILKGRHVLAH